MSPLDPPRTAFRSLVWLAAWAARRALSLHRDARLGVLSAAELDFFDLLARELRGVAERILAGDPPTLREATRRIHEHLVADALARNRGNVTHAARALGVTRTFIYSVTRTPT